MAIEISAGKRGAGSFARESFSHFTLKQEFDAHNQGPSSQRLELLDTPSRIVEIVGSKNYVFSMTKSGACLVYDTVAKQCTGYINERPDEVIRSLFFNRENESLVVVSIYREDSQCELKCRSIALPYIQRGQITEGIPLFVNEALSWPGFIEFDEINSKILTYSASKREYKVWGLKNYELSFTVKDADIDEIKISPGLMLLIYKRAGESVRLDILSMDSGKVLLSFDHPLERDKAVEFFELFNEKLLVKQEEENLRILDLHTLTLTEAKDSKFVAPSAFIFLYEKRLFLTFKRGDISVWDFNGSYVTRFEDHTLWHIDDANTIYITNNQDYIISYCTSTEGFFSEGSVNISEISTGRCLAKIESDGDEEQEKERCRALDCVTALFFNEERNELYTGNKAGLMHVWAN